MLGLGLGPESSAVSIHSDYGIGYIVEAAKAREGYSLLVVVHEVCEVVL